MRADKHVIILVHGIRTFGDWQDRFYALVKAINPTAEVHVYKYRYLSALAFLVPPLRNRVISGFRKYLVTHTEAWRDARVDIVAHSFGTYLVAKAIAGLPDSGPRFGTVILSGSVLKVSFPWNESIARGTVERVINDCGRQDVWPLIAQVLVWGMGIAGRYGFVGVTGPDVGLVNRFFPFGHSGFFVATERYKTNDAFMERAWLPLLTSDEKPGGESLLHPKARWFAGFEYAAEPLKLALVGFVCFGIFVGYGWVKERLAEGQRNDSLLLASRSEQETARGNAGNGMLLALHGLPSRFDVPSWMIWKDRIGLDRPAAPETLGALIDAMAEQRELASWGQSGHPPPQGTDQVLAVTQTPSLVAVIDGDSVRLVNSADGTEAGRLQSKGPDTYPAARPFGLIVDTKRRRAITTRSYMELDFWNIDTMEHLKSLQVQSKTPLRLGLNINGDILAAGSEDFNVYLIDLESMEIVNSISADYGITATAFSPDGSRLASSFTDGGISLWSSTNWRLAESTVAQPVVLVARDGYREPISMAFSSDGSRFAAAYREGGILVWEFSDPDRPQEAEGLSGFATTVIFSGSGQVLAAGYEDGTIRVVDLAAGSTVEHMTAGKRAIASLAFADEDRLVSLDSAGTLRLWTASPRYRLRAKLSSQTWSADCVVFAGDQPGLIVRRSLSDGIFGGGEALLQRLEVDGLGDVVRHESWGFMNSTWDRTCGELAASTDFLATAATEHTHGAADRVSNPATAGSRRPSVTLALENLVEGVKPVATRDGKAVVGATAAGRIALWDALGVPIASWKVSQPVVELDLSPDDRLVLARMTNGEVRLWPIATSVAALIAEARNRLPRCFTVQEAADFGLVIPSSGTSDTIRVKGDPVSRNCGFAPLGDDGRGWSPDFAKSELLAP